VQYNGKEVKRMFILLAGKAAGVDEILDENGHDVAVAGEGLKYFFWKPNAESQGEWIKDFPVCQIENYRECRVTPEELFDGTFWKWLQTQSRPFEPVEQIKSVPLKEMYGMVIYPFETAPHFDADQLAAEGKIAPLRRGPAGIVEADFDGHHLAWRVLTQEYFDPAEPGNNKWLILVEPKFDFDDKGNIIDYNKETYDQWSVEVYNQEMNYQPVLITPYQYYEFPDPLVAQTFARYPDIWERGMRFIEGDFSALSQPGIVLLTVIGYNPYEPLYR